MAGNKTRLLLRVARHIEKHYLAGQVAPAFEDILVWRKMRADKKRTVRSVEQANPTEKDQNDQLVKSISDLLKGVDQVQRDKRDRFLTLVLSRAVDCVLGCDAHGISPSAMLDKQLEMEQVGKSYVPAPLDLGRP